MENGAAAVRNPVFAVLFSPRRVLPGVISRPPRLSVLAMAVAAEAAIGAVTFFGAPMMPERLHWLALIAFTLVFAVVLGIFGLYFAGAAMRTSGRLLGGRATQRQMRAVYAWSSAPMAVCAVLLLAGILLFRQEFLRFGASLSGETPGPGALPGLLVLALYVAAGMWTLVLRIRSISAVQGFGIGRAIANYILAASSLVLLAILIRTFLYQPFNIPSGSMQPTLQTGDYILVSKARYGFGRYSFPVELPWIKGRLGGGKVKRGEMVVFWLPGAGAHYVKRAVGLPGDEIQIQDGVLFVNGEPARMEPDSSAGRHIETLPGGKPHQIVSSPRDNTPVYKVPPGHYFVLGDNRGQSVDSRSPRVGFVPRENLIGKVVLTLFSAEPVKGSPGWDQAFTNLRLDKMMRPPR